MIYDVLLANRAHFLFDLQPLRPLSRIRVKHGHADTWEDGPCTPLSVLFLPRPAARRICDHYYIGPDDFNEVVCVRRISAGEGHLL